MPLPNYETTKMSSWKLFGRPLYLQMSALALHCQFACKDGHALVFASSGVKDIAFFSCRMLKRAAGPSVFRVCARRRSCNHDRHGRTLCWRLCGRTAQKEHRRRVNSLRVDRMAMPWCLQMPVSEQLGHPLHGVASCCPSAQKIGGQGRGHGSCAAGWGRSFRVKYAYACAQA